MLPKGELFEAFPFIDHGDNRRTHAGYAYRYDGYGFVTPLYSGRTRKWHTSRTLPKRDPECDCIVTGVDMPGHKTKRAAEKALIAMGPA